jgi:hypothetical protein
MSKVITSAARITCAHQGTVSPVPSQRKLKIQSSPVLLAADLVGAPIAGCTNLPTTTSPQNVPCTETIGATAGTSTKVTVDGTPVLLDSAQGSTNGSPAAQWSVQSPGQQRVNVT